MRRSSHVLLVLTAISCGDTTTEDTVVVQQPDSGVVPSQKSDAAASTKKGADSGSTSLADSRPTKDPCDDPPIFSVRASGIADFSYEHKKDCTSIPVIHTFVRPTQFTHSLAPNGPLNDPAVFFSVADLSRVPSGKVFALYQPMRPDLLHVAVTRLSSEPKTCSSMCHEPPPQPGTVSVSYSGTTAGSDIEITVDGYLCCTQDSKKTKERFTYHVKGQAL